MTKMATRTNILRYSDRLRAGRPGFNSQQGQETFLLNTKTGFGTHLAPYSLGNECSFPEGRVAGALS
jgi:hypothetical protein